MDEEVYFFANEEADSESDSEDFDLMCKSPPLSERLKKRNRQRKSPSKWAQTNKTDTDCSNGECSNAVTLDSAEAKALQQQLQQQQTSAIRINSSENAMEPAAAVQRRPNSKKIQQARVQRNNSFPSLPSHYERLRRTSSLKKKNHSIRYDEKFEDIDEDLINSENIKDDADSRSQFYDKFTQILKLFIRTNANTCDMPPTPTSQNGELSQSIGLHKLKVLNEVTETIENQELSPEISKTIISATKESLKPNVFENAKVKRLQSVKSMNSENIWFELYDFFVFYENRIDNVDIIKEKVIATRHRLVTLINTLNKTLF